MIKLASAPTLTHRRGAWSADISGLYLSLFHAWLRVGRGHRNITEAVAGMFGVCVGRHVWWESTRLFGRFAVMIVSTITSEVWPKQRKKTRCSARTDCGGVTTPGVPPAIVIRALAVCTND